MDLRLTTVTDADNPVLHDLYLDPSGNIQFIDGIEAILQNIKIKLEFWLGNWFLNVAEGVPYREVILVRGNNELRAKDLFRRLFLATPGVAEVTYLSYSLDRNSNTATLEFELRADTGEVIRSQDYGPFIVEVG